jgi:hypothetical protein
MASFGKHLHAAKNNKLAKYTESVNFAYLSKRTQRGFDLLRSEPKNLRHNRHNKYKKNAKGLRPFQGPNQKTFGTIGTISAKRMPRGFDLFKVRTKKPLAQ